MKRIILGLVIWMLGLGTGAALAAAVDQPVAQEGFHAVANIDPMNAVPLKRLTNGQLDAIEGGLIGPDQDLHDFPRWIWPVIRTAGFNFDAVMFNPQPEPPGKFLSSVIR